MTLGAEAGAHVGREHELALSRSALDAVQAGASVALAIRGEAGMGKTRLLTEIAAMAERNGWVAVTGRASPLERDLPFGIFVDALDEPLRMTIAEHPERVGRELAGELARVFPALPAVARETPRALDERYRDHRAVRDLLELMAPTLPVVLALDDVHWADGASIALIGALLRRPPRAGLLVAMSLRPYPCDPRLAASLDVGGAQRVELTSLSQRDAARLLGPSMPAGAVESLHRQAGGNPFYLTQLAFGVEPAQPEAARAARPPTVADSVPSKCVPPAVSASVEQELGLLSGEALAAVRAAAVAGETFDPELVAATAGLDVEGALAAIDELLACELLRQADTPRRFRFRNPVVRAAVYSEAPGGWRLLAHSRAAAALGAAGAGATDRAPHVEQSAPVGDSDAIALLRAAAAAEHGDPQAAARWLGAALRLLPHDPETRSERAELLRALSSSLAAADRPAASRDALVELLRVLPDWTPEARAPLIADCAALERSLGRQTAARDRLTEALVALPDKRSPLAATLMLGLGDGALFGMHHARATEWSARALEIADEVGPAPLTAAAAALCGLAAAVRGDRCRADSACARAAAIIENLPDAALAAQADGVLYLAWGEWFLERYDDSLRHSERGMLVATRAGQARLVSQLMQTQVSCLMLRDPICARELQQRATEAARKAGNPMALAWALLTDAWIAYMIGCGDEALDAAREGLASSPGLEDNAVLALGRSLLAALQPHRGGTVPRVNASRSAGGPAVMSSLTAVAMVGAQLRCGRLRDAKRTARRAEQLAEPLGLAMPACWAQRARAAVLLAERDAPAACAAAIGSARSAERVGARVEGARSRVLAARAFTAAGDRDRAREELWAAALTFDRFGTNRLRAEAERELRRLGTRFRRVAASVAGAAALTPRELDVADLVAARRTNREIASELYVSQKTVESHMRSIFRKLGISTRDAVAPALADSRHAVQRPVAVSLASAAHVPAAATNL